MSVPLSSTSRDVLPLVWPGVWMARRGRPTESRSPSASVSVDAAGQPVEPVDEGAGGGRDEPVPERAGTRLRSSNYAGFLAVDGDAGARGLDDLIERAGMVGMVVGKYYEANVARGDTQGLKAGLQRTHAPFPACVDEHHLRPTSDDSNPGPRRPHLVHAPRYLHRPPDAHAPPPESVATHSTWCVWGNMSTGSTLSTENLPSTSTFRSRASAAGSQET